MPKTKLSVTVESDLVEELDDVARGSSRSQVVERALAQWLRERRRAQLEDDIERYYLEMGTEERSEDAEWAELSARHLDRGWS